MSYKVIQKNKENYYLYEVTATWDPEKKKNIQSRKYLGKCDEHGILVKTPSKTVDCIEFGRGFVFCSVLKQIGLDRKLEDVFGKKNADILKGFGIMTSSRDHPISQMPDLINDTVIPRLIKTEQAIDKKRLADTLIECNHKKEDLFRTMLEGTKVTVYAVDHVPVPYQMRWRFITEQDYGYIYTPEFTTYIGICDETGLPCYYKRIYEKISQPETVVRIRDELRTLGATEICFVFDHKKGNINSLKELIEKGIDFVCPAYPDTDFYESILKRSSDVLTGGGKTELLFGEICKFSETEERIGDKQIHVLTYLNIKRYQNEARIVFTRGREFRKTLKDMKWSEDLMYKLANDYGYSDMLPFYSLTKTENGNIGCAERQGLIDRADLSWGKTILLTNTNMSWEKAAEYEVMHGWFDMEMYKLRENLPFISNMFHSYPESESTMILEFVSFAVRLTINNRLLEIQDYQHSVQDLVDGLNGICIYKTDNKWGICGINEVHSRILSILGIELPKDSEIGNIMCNEGN